MILNIQDDILKLHSMDLLDKLLLDKTTGKHIMWATDTYTALGPRYERNEQITPELITGPNQNPRPEGDGPAVQPDTAARRSLYPVVGLPEDVRLRR